MSKIYKIQFAKQAQKDLEYFKKSGDKIVLKKIAVLLKELKIHPQTGTGKPEKLKFQLSGFWSRRISKEHRLVYKIEEDTLVVLTISLKGHY